MRQKVTIVLSLLLTIFFVGDALAQTPTDVTVREINAIPQAGLDAVKQLGTDLTEADIQTHIRSPFDGMKVKFTAVVLSNPKNSGLSTPTDLIPSRIHFFVRDTTANSAGKGGMDVQIVDGDFQSTGTFNLFVGDVVTFVANVQYFGVDVQLSPETIEPLGSYTDLGFTDDLLAPVEVTVSDLNMNMGELMIQANWDNFNNLNQQYVSIKNSVIWRSPNRTDSRPNWAFTDDKTETLLQADDISLRFRNDRIGTYSDIFNLRDENDPFVAPPAGAAIEVRGFALLRSDWDPFNIGAPSEGVMKIVPWDDEDLVITADPTIGDISLEPLAAVPGNAATTVNVTVEADVSDIDKVTLVYNTSSSSEAASVDMTLVSGTTYMGDIPTQADRAHGSYSVNVLDTNGAEFSSESSSFRTLFDGVNSIDDIQETADDGPGPSSLEDFTTAMDITATVQTTPATSGFLIVQDNADLNAWSGIAVENTDAVSALNLAAGDVIKITNGTVVELRGPNRFDRSGDVTGIAAPTVEVVSTGGAALAPKEVTTDVLQNESVAEAHESMVLLFRDTKVSDPNPDAPSNFGEFALSSDGTVDNQVRFDDESAGFPEEFNLTLTAGQDVTSAMGVMSETFGNYKMMPETDADVMTVGTAIEDETVPAAYELYQNFPNPFNPVTSIRYDIARTGTVTLEVFDSLGRRVAMLVDGEQTAGTHRVQFDARNLASGLYLYRLTAGSEVSTKKMLLLK